MKRVFIPIAAMLVMLLASSFLFADRVSNDVRKSDTFKGLASAFMQMFSTLRETPMKSGSKEMIKI